MRRDAKKADTDIGRRGAEDRNGEALRAPPVVFLPLNSALFTAPRLT
jgi:hypothetical protein